MAAGGFDWKRMRLPLAALATAAAAFALWPPAGVLVAVGWFQFLAARYDNHTGSCLMVAILIVIVLAILTFLVAMTALPYR
jgi:hypothetical protein